MFNHIHAVYIETHGHIFLVLTVFVVVHSQRDTLADAAHNYLTQESLLYHLGTDVGLYGTHAAADVHPHGVGNNHVVGGHHAADGHPHTCVTVGHQCYVMIHERQRGEVLHLL